MIPVLNIIHLPKELFPASSDLYLESIRREQNFKSQAFQAKITYGIWDDIPPFYVGEPVEAVDAISGSLIKNGNKYVISDCHYSYCDNGGMFYWYVGVDGFDNKWMRPSIFRSILPPLQTVTFSKIAEENPVSVN